MFALFLQSIFLVQLSYAQVDYGEHGGIELEINLEKTEYLAGEPIWLDLKATNVTDDDIQVLPLDLMNVQWFRVTIVGPGDDTLDYLGTQGSWGGIREGP